MAQGAEVIYLLKINYLARLALMMIINNESLSQAQRNVAFSERLADPLALIGKSDEASPTRRQPQGQEGSHIYSAHPEDAAGSREGPPEL